MTPEIRDLAQDCNVNILFGSGLSSPFLRLLGDIEVQLTAVEKMQDSRLSELLRVSLYKKYFDGVMKKNLKILSSDPSALEVLNSYRAFLTILNAILLRRKSSILNKEANLFTTNIDIFTEKALEDSGLEFNDGFNGRFSPRFSSSNFKKSHYKKSLHYDNVAELPVFNLFKLHGSLTWEQANNGDIVFSQNLKQVERLATIEVAAGDVLDVPDNASVEALVAMASGKAVGPTGAEFAKEYEKLLIINPTKEKFRTTLLDQTFYELLRLYSNELEKENSVLFVMGFSFADEHILNITLRAANSNPTLLVRIFAHTSKAGEEIKAKFPAESLRNKNVEIVTPPQENIPGGGVKDAYSYDLKTITERRLSNIFEGEKLEADLAESA